jgi:hypothetical protein
MRLKKRGIYIKISIEQEGIYKGKRTTSLRDIYVNPTYIIGVTAGTKRWNEAQRSMIPMS